MRLVVVVCVLVLGSNLAIAQTVERPKVLPTEASRIGGLTMGTDGRWLASYEDAEGDAPAAIRVWDLRTLRPIETAAGSTPTGNDDEVDGPSALPMMPFAMARRSPILMSATIVRGTVRTWRLASDPKPRILDPESILTGAELPIRDLQLSDDGRRMLTVTDKIVVRNLAEGKPIAEFELHNRLERVAASPDLATIAVASFQDVDLFDVATRKRTRSLLDHRGSVGALAFSADGKILVVASTRLEPPERETTALKVWNCETGKEIASLPECSDTATGLLVDASADRIVLFTGSAADDRPGRVRLLDRAVGRWIDVECRDSKGRGPLCVTANPSLTLVAAGFGDGSIQLHDVRWSAKR